MLDEVFGNTGPAQECQRNLALGTIDGVDADRRRTVGRTVSRPFVAEVVVSKGRSANECVAEVRPSEICPTEICPPEVRIVEACPAHVSATDIRIDEACSCKVRATKVCISKYRITQFR